MVEPNRAMETLKPVKSEPTPAGGWLIDMGKNYTGWLELRLPPDIAEGTNLKIEFADNPPAGGRYATFNQRDEYVTRASAGQLMRSRFNYHAFRYAHVTGLDKAPAPADVQGYLLRTSYGRAGEFESSDDLMNRIYRLVTWTYGCLTLNGYIVDCPTRERLGYGGDAGTSIETGMFNFDTAELYSRWAADWRDAPGPEDRRPPVHGPPLPRPGRWRTDVERLRRDSALAGLPPYGDRRSRGQVSEHPEMAGFRRLEDHGSLLEVYVSTGIRMPEWNFLGDWVAPRRGRQRSTDIARNQVSSRFINNAHYLYTLDLAAKIAAVLDKPADAAMFTERAATLRRSLHERFYNANDQSYATGEQPYLSLALLLGIAPQELRAAVMKNLEDTILVKNTGHFDSGMHGTYFLIKQLMDADRNDLIYQMTSKKDFPSWGNMLEQGATTSWESWTGGSHIHDTLISIGAWFIQGIGGIQADEKAPGFRHFFPEAGAGG